MKGLEPGYHLLPWFVPYLEEHLPLDCLTSSVFGRQRPNWLLFLTFLPLEYGKIISSIDRGDILRFFSFFPLNSWLAILHINTKFLMQWFYNEGWQHLLKPVSLSCGESDSRLKSGKQDCSKGSWFSLWLEQAPPLKGTACRKKTLPWL